MNEDIMKMIPTPFTRIELLAPAKDLECGRAAIDCGADAVYMGATRFGARAAAGNALEAIAELTAYAHAYWARIYITLNTLVRDRELPDAVRLVEQLYEIGIDGLIIQDVGLLECDLPPLPIIASTQMHNNSPDRVAFLEKVGFQRAILARELTLAEIQEIRTQTTLELECFVHGALCVGYSGQCQLSYALGGRSGNRGQCAQPCRKAYRLIDGTGKTLVENKHLLSVRDLCLSDQLRPLLRAGITSFKIEGRLKDRGYVTNVVAHYRQALDSALETEGLKRGSSGQSAFDFTPDLTKTFNRGYCDYFLYGRRGAIGAIDTPKMMGERIGTVTAVTSQGVQLEDLNPAAAPLHPGDGVCYRYRNGVVYGSTLNRVEGAFLVPETREGFEPGLVLYRNHDHQFLSLLKKSKIRRRIEVSMTFYETDEGYCLVVEDEDGIQAETHLIGEKKIAEKAEQAQNNIQRQLAKTGDTLFSCVQVSLCLRQPAFIPVSALNQLRRETLNALSVARETRRPICKGGVKVNDFPFPEKHLSYLGNALNQKSVAFYRRHGVETIEPAVESGGDLQGKKVMTARYCIRHQLKCCPRMKSAPSLVEPLYLVDDENNKLKLIFDCTRCEMDIFLE